MNYISKLLLLCCLAGTVVVAHGEQNESRRQALNLFHNSEDPVDRCLAACSYCFSAHDAKLLSCANDVCISGVGTNFPRSIEEACTLLIA
ncbi:unnamed protein product [Dicrocoelium dendriticum]|nr:unnamed protein product [Dicrocoelium dendriticum]